MVNMPNDGMVALEDEFCMVHSMSAELEGEPALLNALLDDFIRTITVRFCAAHRRAWVVGSGFPGRKLSKDEADEFKKQYVFIDTHKAWYPGGLA